jgi:amino acid transporter
VDRALKAVAHPYQRRKPTNEKLRAWAVSVAIVTGLAAAAGALFAVGIAAVLNLGTIPGLAVLFTLFCLATGTGLWLANGKQRP